MTINAKVKEKAARLLREGASFMLFREPGRAPRLCSGKGSTMQTSVVPWRTAFCDAVKINGKKGNASFRLPEATSREEYIERLGRLIGELKKRGNCKTVISRVIRSKVKAGFDWLEAADALWEAFPDSFGYLFYTPSTGAWLGATPEKLLTVYAPDHFTTHALAGTLPVASAWNVKNYEEQQLVTDFIERCLNDLKLPFCVQPMRDVVYGQIKHLCTPFTGQIPRENREAVLVELLDTLAPTPALSGFPREEAFADIESVERHARQCYGGYIAVEKSPMEDVRFYVTIRCVQFDSSTGECALYAGGGITPKSEPEAEWDETEAKASKLMQIING